MCVAFRYHLYAGMLSKSKGQILRVSAALHVLFHLGTVEDVEPEISESSIAASIDFVRFCCQQAFFMAGRGNMFEKVQILNAC